jgi:hypothetical protein
MDEVSEQAQKDREAERRKSRRIKKETCYEYTEQDGEEVRKVRDPQPSADYDPAGGGGVYPRRGGSECPELFVL